MKKSLKGFLSYGLAFAMLFGITAIGQNVIAQDVPFVAEAASSYTGTYYNGITATSGKELSGQLHDLIVSTHKVYTSYADVKTYTPTTDPGKGSNTVMEFYTQTDIASSNFDKSGGWNREHVWPQSDSGDLWGTSGAGSDLHHIRPAEKDLNNSRGNKLYGEVTGGKEEYTSVTHHLGGFSNGSTFMPMDKVKGDIARILMYVYLHYNSASNVGGTKETSAKHGTLKFTQIITASNEAAAQQLLLKWNEEDKVDDIERARNEAIFEIQKNRNPFIDHPEYANAIWGGGSIDPNPGGDVTPPKPSDTLEKITLNKAYLSLTVGASEKLTVTPTPSDAEYSVNWTSSNTSVASVASDGTVTAKAAGTATITVASKNDPNIKDTAQITVKNADGSTPPTPPTPPPSTDTKKVTITINSFATRASYSVQSWTEGALSGSAYVYTSEKKLQFNNNNKYHSQYIAGGASNISPITSVTLKLTSGSTDWHLYTSSTAYGEFNNNGNPTTGNDWKTLTANSTGVTWKLSGNDTYFSLVYEGSGATYIDSIELTFADGTGSGGGEDVGGGGDVGGGDEVDYTKLNAFHASVAAIQTKGAFEARLASINTAISAYRALSAEEKKLAAADVQLLQSKIDDYNNAVRKYNDEARTANEAVHGR